MLENSWPWYISGPLIGLTIPLLFYFKNKAFGVSSSFTHICQILTIKDKKKREAYKKVNIWNIHFVSGIILASIFIYLVDGSPNSGDLHNQTFFGYQASENGTFPNVFSTFNFIFSFEGLLYLGLGGFLVGFGTRYANGCTSGHAIMGLSNLQYTSLIAVIGFFIGGLLITYGLRPLAGAF